tara:strand:+ start:21303 stop:22574 length:1272 start_codon:yes stop_codon:yes gene_type:complete
MNNKTQITAAAIITAATTGFAAAGSLELDRAYAAELKADAGTRSVLNQGNMSNVEVSVGVIFGYSFNSADGRAPADNDDTMGFGFNEAQVAIEGDVTDNMRGRVSFDFGPNDAGAGAGGTATLEDAYVDWTVNDSMTLRVGQFVPAYSAEASTSEFHTMNTYRSVSHEWLATPSWTQGVEAHFSGDTWGFAVGFNDGPNTANTAYNAGGEADFAINARFDMYSDSDKARFDDQTSWRGSAAGWRVGAGVLFASYGDTNPSAVVDTEDTWFTIDGAYEADGWAVRAAFYYADNEVTATANPSNMGFEVGGSFFFSDQWEGFARWDTLIVDDDASAGQTTNEDTFNFLAVGANYYFVPESHAAVFTIELGVSLDETSDLVGVAGDTGVGVLGGANGATIGSSGFFQENAGEDGQIMLSGTMQWMF